MTKRLEAYGVAGKQFTSAEDARGHTYTTRDNGFPSTPLAFWQNPFSDEFLNAKVILDIGCGVGRNLPWILENTNAIYVGLEPNESMRAAFFELQQIRGYEERVVVVANFDELDALSLRDWSFPLLFDAVVCTFVFQHIGFRPAAEQMNITDITQEVFKRSAKNAPWMLYEHEGEELWIDRWFTENTITPTVYIRDFAGLPELTHRGLHHLIIFETPE